MIYLFLESFIMKCILPARLWYTIITELWLKNVGHVFLTFELIVFLFDYFYVPRERRKEVSKHKKCSTKCSLFTNSFDVLTFFRSSIHVSNKSLTYHSCYAVSQTSTPSFILHNPKVDLTLKYTNTPVFCPFVFWGNIL